MATREQVRAWARAGKPHCDFCGCTDPAELGPSEDVLTHWDAIARAERERTEQAELTDSDGRLSDAELWRMYPQQMAELQWHKNEMKAKRDLRRTCTDDARCLARAAIGPGTPAEPLSAPYAQSDLALLLAALGDAGDRLGTVPVYLPAPVPRGTPEPVQYNGRQIWGGRFHLTHARYRGSGYGRRLRGR